MIVFVNASSAVQTIHVSGRSAAGVAFEKQQQFAQAVMERAKPLTDRVGAAHDIVALKVNEGTECVTAMVNGMLVRFKFNVSMIVRRISNQGIQLETCPVTFNRRPVGRTTPIWQSRMSTGECEEEQWMAVSC